jgi:hypothetical protein
MKANKLQLARIRGKKIKTAIEVILNNDYTNRIYPNMGLQVNKGYVRQKYFII